MIIKEVIGMDKQAAIDLIKSRGYSYRIRVENGQSFASTTDLKPNRVNLYIEDGKVVKANLG